MLVSWNPTWPVSMPPDLRRLLPAHFTTTSGVGGTLFTDAGDGVCVLLHVPIAALLHNFDYMLSITSMARNIHTHAHAYTHTYIHT